MKVILNKLTYITYQVFPSQKANSIQTIRMCENLSLKKIAVRLIYPKRGALDFRNVAINNFYNVENEFEILPLAHKLPFNYIKYFEKISFLFSSFIWSFYSVRKVMKNLSTDEVIMTRTHWIILFLWKYKNLSIFECHKYSKINNLIFKLLKDKKNLVIVFTNLNLQKSFSLSNNLEKKSIILESSYDDRLFEDKETYSKKQKNRVVFVGQLLRFNKKRDLEFLINTFKKKGLENFELRIIGGPNHVVEELKKISGINTKLLGHLSNKNAIKEMESAEFGILINEKSQHSEMHTSPIKYFEYLRAGLKVLAVDFESHRNLPIKDNIYFFEKSNSLSFKTALLNAAGEPFVDNPELSKFSYSYRVDKLIDHLARLEGLEPPTL